MGLAVQHGAAFGGIAQLRVLLLFAPFLQQGNVVRLRFGLAHRIAPAGGQPGSRFRDRHGGQQFDDQRLQLFVDGGKQGDPVRGGRSRLEIGRAEQGFPQSIE